MSAGIWAVTSGAWMPLRWQISMVVGEGRMLMVLPVESVRTMVLIVSEKATSWSDGASVMRTGTETAAEVMLEAAPGEMADEQPRAAARAKMEIAAMRLAGRAVVRTFMGWSPLGGSC